MAKQIREPMARTVLLRFPSGATQYWLTDHEFTVGTSVPCNGGEWIVSAIEPASDGAVYVTVQPVREVSPVRESEVTAHARPSDEPTAA